MKSSDFLMKEILERLEGKLAAETKDERAAQKQDYRVIVIDVPRPQRPVPPALPVVADSNNGKK